MCIRDSAIGIEQLNKLPGFIDNRIANAKYFQSKFIDNKNFIIQKEIGKSSWFGFSFIIKDESNLERENVIKFLNSNGVETRPIVTGNFLNNPVIKYFDYKVHENVKNAEKLDKKGFFVGNHHYQMNTQIDLLSQLINKL